MTCACGASGFAPSVLFGKCEFCDGTDSGNPLYPESSMHVLTVRNVNEAYARGVQLLRNNGDLRDSRNGPVLCYPGPVATVYRNPLERVLFDPRRDANPFFHLMEAIWILGGRNDVAWLTRFNKRIADYSDDGRSFHGAYGFRLRRQWGFDQLEQVADLLLKDPNTRQAVCSIWDPMVDNTDRVTKDRPCNDFLQWDVRADGRLHLTVFCRSNDLVWGTYGANAVQFSVLLEYMAAMIGHDVGTYTQVSANYHGYLSTLPEVEDVKWPPCPYERGEVRPHAMVVQPDVFDREVDAFLSMTGVDAVSIEGMRGLPYCNWWFHTVAEPMAVSYLLWKAGRRQEARALLGEVAASDWQKAAMAWMDRRLAAKIQVYGNTTVEHNGSIGIIPSEDAAS